MMLDDNGTSAQGSPTRVVRCSCRGGAMLGGARPGGEGRGEEGRDGAGRRRKGQRGSGKRGQVGPGTWKVSAPDCTLKSTH